MVSDNSGLAGMKVLRDAQILRGYLIERPFDGWPAITHCGEALCVPGHHLPAHRHPVFEMLLLTGGRAYWSVGRREIVQEVGDLFVAFPGQVHRTGPRANPENQHLWIGVNLASLGPTGQRLARRLAGRRLQLVPKCSELEPLLRGVMAQAISRQPQASAVARRYLEVIVALLSQRTETTHETAAAPELAPCSVPVQRCLAYLRANLHRRLSLEEISRVGAMRNVAYFCTRFRRETGQAPAATHLNLRLEAAKAALRRTDATITTVALQYGFCSSQHFGGAFRVAFGITPRAWRDGLMPHPRERLRRQLKDRSGARLP